MLVHNFHTVYVGLVKLSLCLTLNMFGLRTFKDMTELLSTTSVPVITILRRTVVTTASIILAPLSPVVVAAAAAAAAANANAANAANHSLIYDISFVTLKIMAKCQTLKNTLVYVSKFLQKFPRAKHAPSEAVISLSVCTCTHVHTSTFFGFFIHVCRCVMFCFSDGSLFCLLVHIKRVFFAHVRVCTLENDYRSTCVHVYMLHGCIFSPKNMHPCNM